MKELQVTELENINDGINWWEVAGSAAEIAGSIPEDATGIGAAQATVGVNTIWNGITGRNI